MADVFEGIWGQPKVRAYFRASVASGSLSHATLLVGPAGSGKTAAAYALAAARLCGSGGCGACDTCRRVLRRVHPDVHYFAPEGTSSYLVGQMRDIMADVALAPIQAQAKVYIVDRADLLNAAAANAFLKTLEEPPADVMLILLARTVDAVLPTIVSRCQVVPFRTVPEAEALGLVCQNAGVSEDRARLALSACDGSAERAVAFAQSNERMEHAREAYEDLRALRQADDWDVLKISKKFVVAAEAPLDDVRRDQEEYREANADFLTNSALKKIKERDERAVKAVHRQAQIAELALIKSWLRDVMATCVGTGGATVGASAREGIRESASSTTEARAASAIRLVDETAAALAYNVSPQTCFDTLLFDIREVLYD